MKVDSHQHFWCYNPEEHIWMTDQMAVLRRDYLPPELQPQLESVGFAGTVAVQARQLPVETKWLLELAETYPFIKGVVGWVDLCSDHVEGQLEKFSRYSKLRGVRHVVHDEPDDGFMLRPEFRRGIAQLLEYGLTFDLLLYPRHIPVAVRLVQEFPAQPFVLDHIGKPDIGAAELSPWKEDLQMLARFPNVFCKISGMVTEASWNVWKAEEFHRYIDIVIGTFGTDRVMIGSDWPVCTLSGSYADVMSIVIDYVGQFSPEVQERILGGNCTRFYGIDF